ncbi:hypothetical protein AK812_SmicGene45646, partial [Symbiodinium microadriaticum]
VMQTGRITLDELMESIKSLTSKATPFDTCCLTARIGGTATFTTRLVTRTDIVAATLEDVRYKLRLGIDELTRASIEDEELTQVPEVFLRKSGHINHYKESSTAPSALRSGVLPAESAYKADPSDLHQLVGISGLMMIMTALSTLATISLTMLTMTVIMLMEEEDGKQEEEEDDD